MKKIYKYEVFHIERPSKIILFNNFNQWYKVKHLYDENAWQIIRSDIKNITENNSDKDNERYFIYHINRLKPKRKIKKGGE